MKIKSLDYNDQFKQLKINMIKSIDYMEYHSYYAEDVKMFYDMVQYHMVEETIRPE